MITLLPQMLVDAILQGSLYALLAMGVTLCFGVVRIINFAHGEFVMLGAYAAWWLHTQWGIDPLLAMPLVAVLGMALGMALFRLCVAQVLDAPHLNQILLTFGIGMALQNAVLMAFTGDARSSQPPYELLTLDWGPVLVPVGSLIAAGVMAAVMTGLFAWLNRSELGRSSQAIAQNRQAATLVGIDVKAVYGIAFGISAALAAVSGALASFILVVTPFMGFPIIVKAFAIVIVGGLGSPLGTILGAYVLAFAETAVSYFVPDGSGWSEGVAFALLLVTLLLRPRGIVPQMVEE